MKHASASRVLMMPRWNDIQGAFSRCVILIPEFFFYPYIYLFTPTIIIEWTNMPTYIYGNTVERKKTKHF
jgi:hypothetical protein